MFSHHLMHSTSSASSGASFTLLQLAKYPVYRSYSVGENLSARESFLTPTHDAFSLPGHACLRGHPKL